MKPSRPFQITESDVYRSTTLTGRDIGKWAILICGCYQLFQSYSDAANCYDDLILDARNSP